METMAWSGRKALSKYTYNQLKGHFLGFIVGTSAAGFVSTFFETRKISNLWGLTSSKTVVSGDTFRFLEWSCSLVAGFIAFEVVNNLAKEKLSTRLERISLFVEDRGWVTALDVSAPRVSKTIKWIVRQTKTLADSESDADASEPAAASKKSTD
jgi:hypothetical protein